MAQGAEFHHSTIIAQPLLFSTLPQPVSNMADFNVGELTPSTNPNEIFTPQHVASHTGSPNIRKLLGWIRMSIGENRPLPDPFQC